MTDFEVYLELERLMVVRDQQGEDLGDGIRGVMSEVWLRLNDFERELLNRRARTPDGSKV